MNDQDECVEPISSLKGQHQDKHAVGSKLKSMITIENMHKQTERVPRTSNMHID